MKWIKRLFACSLQDNDIIAAAKKMALLMAKLSQLVQVKEDVQKKFNTGGVAHSAQIYYLAINFCLRRKQVVSV